MKGNTLRILLNNSRFVEGSAAASCFGAKNDRDSKELTDDHHTVAIKLVA